MRLHKFARLAVIAASLGIMVLPMVSHVPHAFAALTFDNPVSDLGTADLRTTVINIIKLALGLMSLIAVTLVIYGGFVWLTAAGNEENVEKAKKIISAAVIGLIIILLAWAIVSFVANTAKNVTNV